MNPLDTNVIAAIVALLVIERVGVLIVNVIGKLRDGPHGNLQTCRPAPSAIAAFAAITDSQVKIAECVKSIAEECKETRRMSASLLGKTDRVLDRLSNNNMAGHNNSGG